MKLYDLLPNTETIFEKAFSHPVMKIKPRAANPYPSYEDAVKATVNAIEYCLIDTVNDEMIPIIQGVLDMRVLMDGEADDADDKDEWESATDDQVEAAIEKYMPILSQDWLGEKTIGCGIHLKDGVEKFCSSLGREVFKQLTYALDKSPAKILSAAGIGSELLNQRLALHNQTPKEVTMEAQDQQLAVVINKMAEYLGKDFDIMEINDDLDFASGDDDILAQGAAARLGVEPEDIEVLQGVRLMQGDDAPQILLDMIKAELSGEKPKAAKPKPHANGQRNANAKPKAPAKPRATKAAAKVEGAVSAETLQKFKEACQFKDADEAAKLGVSRATFNNWINGKSNVDLSDDKVAELRDSIVNRANALLEAIAEIDGTEPHVVF